MEVWENELKAFSVLLTSFILRYTSKKAWENEVQEHEPQASVYTVLLSLQTSTSVLFSRHCMCFIGNPRI